MILFVKFTIFTLRTLGKGIKDYCTNKEALPACYPKNDVANCQGRVQRHFVKRSIGEKAEEVVRTKHSQTKEAFAHLFKGLGSA